MTDLVGLTQIAERLGVPRNTVDSWRRRGKLSEPERMIGIHPYWEWETIRIGVSESSSRGAQEHR